MAAGTNVQSIMAAFSNSPQAQNNNPNAAPAPKQPDQQFPANTGQPPANSGQPGAQPSSGAPSSESTGNTGTNPPFAGLEKLWENDNTNSGDGAGKKSGGIFGDITAETFTKGAANANFVRTLPPELQQRMAAGGEDAIKANFEAMNMVAQQVYAQAAHTNVQLIEHGVKQALGAFAKQLPAFIKKHNISNMGAQKHPIFSNPAAAPMVEAMQSQFARQFPKATEGQILEMVEKYFTDLGSVGAPKKDDTNSGSGADGGDTDWTKYIGVS